MKNNVKALPLIIYSDTKTIVDKFPSIESRDSIFSNIAGEIMIYTAFLLPSCLFCPLFLVVKRYDVGLLLAILFVIILQIRKYKNPIPNYKIIVNKEGAEYYNEENELLGKVLYKNLLSPIISPKPKYDIDLVFNRYNRITSNIRVWTLFSLGLFPDVATVSMYGIAKKNGAWHGVKRNAN
ncbi:hypothetical protein [Chryseobacterium vrystaatense]|uniref:Uncharacterized protein n=1 Tax=Chryseobacterium vrystaatense TaxID=307480 RepID=A0A1M5HDJ5_9FLAO|nr:hypothetical protein [Chryseobacterium vrystaatense]SHG13958.1 hypothetical protein SAMN02787073_3667 [Chryseobacterium vrystaatense]